MKGTTKQLVIIMIVLMSAWLPRFIFSPRIKEKEHLAAVGETDNYISFPRQGRIDAWVYNVYTMLSSSPFK